MSYEVLCAQIWNRQGYYPNVFERKLLSPSYDALVVSVQGRRTDGGRRELPFYEKVMIAGCAGFLGGIVGGFLRSRSLFA